MTLSDFVKPLEGGLLIGAASAGLLLFNGRIAGISGILRGLATTHRTEFFMRLLFLVGLVVGAWGYQRHFGQFSAAREHMPSVLLFGACLMVGIGTGLARGCTSGHGVCGLSRFSRRSFVAVGVFLSVAIVAAVLTRHVFGVY